ncbi:phage tail tube protein [Salinispora arenicola]|uniref:phage tail tube protein n=1 Tax=Salinispora arenicola TaxID=168697 RepID=UPI0003A02990|nr:IPT/TIG domain-containing protein [Salinispora arenicola]
MATTPTTRVTELARSSRLDIDTATYPTVVYQQLMGVEEAKLLEELRTEDDEVYDDTGAMREEVTGYAWRIEAKIAWSTNLAGTAIDAVQAFLRSQFKALRTSAAGNAEFGIRWYHRDGLDDGNSHEGRVYVKSWAPSGGKGRETIDIVLQGQGQITDITNPAGSLTPTVTSIAPTSGSTAGSDQVVGIYGQHYMPNGVAAVTAVEFGTDDAIDYTVVSDSHIVAIPPAVAASTVQVRVTTTAGASTDTAADDYTYA